MRRVTFSGVKVIHGESTPFSFAWDVDAVGVWGIIAADNLAGKSTIVQVILWALRGRPKALSKTVANWIKKVAVTFLVDGRIVDIAFTVVDGDPSGEVRVGTGETAQVSSFEDGDQFYAIMEDTVMGALGLSRIPGAQASGDSVVAYEDSWAAYTGAFLTDAHSDALLGEYHPGTDLQQRLLQTFVGLPWVRTMLQARSRSRVWDAEQARQASRVRSAGGQTVEDLKAALAEVERRLFDERARNEIAARLYNLREVRNELVTKVRVAESELQRAQDGAHEAKRILLRSEKAALRFEEEQAAATFFGALRPRRCPRCTSPVDEERYRHELNSNECSICSRPTEPDAGVTATAAAAEARERVDQARKDERAAQALTKRRMTRLERIRCELDTVGNELESILTAGTAADTDTLRSERDRLVGRLDILRELVDEAADPAEGVILGAARDEAQERVEGAATEVLDDVATEMTRIVRRLGMSDVEHIRLKRNAHVDVTKGGSISKWGDLAPGEQLRLRLATVIALSRNAERQGVARHPGLLLIDSPGREEMKDANIQDALAELVTLTKEDDRLQIFIAMRGEPSDLPSVPADRIISAPSGGTLW